MSAKSNSPTTESARIPRAAMIGGIGLVILAGALYLNFASQNWIPNAERRVRDAVQQGEISLSSTSPKTASILPSAELVKATKEASAHPNDVGTQMAYARALADSDHLASAMSVAETAVRLDPKNANAHELLAMIYTPLGYDNLAIAEYKSAIERNPDLLEAYLHLGELYAARGKVADTEKFYRAAVHRAPRIEGPTLSLAGFLMEHHKTDEAVALLAPFVKDPNPPVAALYMTGKMKSEKGRNDEAVALYKQAISKQDKFAECYHALGSVLSNMGNMAEGIPALKRAVELVPANSSYWYALANAYRTEGKGVESLQNARLAFEKSIDLDPLFPFAHYFYGVVLEAQAEREPAIREYYRTLEIQQDFGSAKHRLGTLLKTIGKTAEGEKYLTEFASEARKSIDVVHGGRRDNSFEDTSTAHYQRGLGFLKSGDRTRAIGAFRVAIERDPMNSLARRDLRSLGVNP